MTPSSHDSSCRRLVWGEEPWLDRCVWGSDEVHGLMTTRTVGPACCLRTAGTSSSGGSFAGQRAFPTGRGQTGSWLVKWTTTSSTFQIHISLYKYQFWEDWEDTSKVRRKEREMRAKVHGLARSTCTTRVLVCLEEKGMDYELVPVNMAAGAHKQQPFLSLNV